MTNVVPNAAFPNHQGLSSCHESEQPNPIQVTLVANQPSDPPAQQGKSKPKRKRKPRKFKVAIETELHRSVTSLERSGPSAAASEAIRGSITQMALRTPHRVWVKSAHKYHPYTVTREYDNKKHRRFTLTKAGDSVLNKDAGDPKHQIPSALLQNATPDS